MVRVPHAADVLMQLFQCVLRMLAAEGHGCCYFLVDHHKHSNASLGSPLEDSIETVLLICSRRPTEVKLWAEPPIADPDRGLCFFEDFAERPKVV